ncbi:MAG: hypothetical protein Q8P23_04375 [bacterium]|nr:hypothetical protein [bacterium]
MDSTEINTSDRRTTVNTPNSSSVFTTSNRSTTVTPSDNRRMVVNTLAIVGFVALIGVSMWLAVYSTRYVPGVVGRLGSAAVYLGSVFTPSPEPTLSVIPAPTASSTIISFGEASSTISTNVSSATPKITPKVVATPAPAPTPLYGSPDLLVNVNAIGYLAIDGQFDSFVPSATVPTNKQPAVKFTVRNIGTNISGTWQISTDPKLAFSQEEQLSLFPNRQRDLIIYLDRTNKSSQPLTITVISNFVSERDTANNSISLTFTLGN